GLAVSRGPNSTIRVKSPRTCWGLGSATVLERRVRRVLAWAVVPSIVAEAPSAAARPSRVRRSIGSLPIPGHETQAGRRTCATGHRTSALRWPHLRGHLTDGVLRDRRRRGRKATAQLARRDHASHDAAVPRGSWSTERR